MLQRLGNRYDESQKAWMAAEACIEASRGDSFAEVASLVSNASSFVLNDKMRVYHGHDYERVMLLTYMALNHRAATTRARAWRSGRRTNSRRRSPSAPSSTRRSRRKRAARRAHQRARAERLSGGDDRQPGGERAAQQLPERARITLRGFVYEALGEPSLAAPGYRLANELQPDRPLQRAARPGCAPGASLSAPDDGMTTCCSSSAAAPRPRSSRASSRCRCGVQLRRAAAFVPGHHHHVGAGLAARVVVAEAPCRSSRSPASTRWRAAG